MTKLGKVTPPARRKTPAAKPSRLPEATAGQTPAARAPVAADTGRLEALAAERLAIEGVSIEIDGGRFPAKVVAGWPSRVEADIFSDGHESIDAAFCFRKAGTEDFTEVPMTFFENDRWTAEATFPENAHYECTFLAWRDLYATWRKDTAKKHAAGVDITLELTEARHLLEAALKAKPARADAKSLRDLLKQDEASSEHGERFARLNTAEVAATVRRAAPRTNLTRYKILPVFADRPAAAFSAWYELMPRSMSGDPDRHGTFDDVIAHLPYVQDLGFDVLYFPPIHPIGRINRKGQATTR